MRCVCSFLRYCYIVKIDFVLAKIAVTYTEYSQNRDTAVVLFKFRTCPYLTYLATLPTSGQSICTFTGTVDV